MLFWLRSVYTLAEHAYAGVLREVLCLAKQKPYELPRVADFQCLNACLLFLEELVMSSLPGFLDHRFGTISPSPVVLGEVCMLLLVALI